MLAVGESHVEIRGARAADPVLERVSKTPAQPPADGLADQEAVGVDVVAVGTARLPIGRLRGKRFGHDLPVEHRVRRERPPHAGQAGLVA